MIFFHIHLFALTLLPAWVMDEWKYLLTQQRESRIIYTIVCQIPETVIFANHANSKPILNFLNLY